MCIEAAIDPGTIIEDLDSRVGGFNVDIVFVSF